MFVTETGGLGGAQARGVLIAAIAALFANGCATVVATGTSVATTTVQRDALRNAAADVEEVNWPQPASASLSERLSGIFTASDERITRKDAVKAYLARLGATPQPAAALENDVEDQLAAARALVEATHEASRSVRPTMSDIGVVENVIAVLRQSQSIYLDAAAAVAVDEEAARALRRAIKEDFAAAIDAVGEAADLLADRVAADRTRTMAQDRNKRAPTPSYFADAL